ncbi:MAG: hypothetical protein ACD_46C00548G0002 [uncultured bacterium]|nr:MAG: hypothetical protein ACD_46C00548G0002 [uncultured bacterium]
MTNHLSIVFPGQGSQSLGMLSDVAEQFSEVALTFEEASDALGYDLWTLTQIGPEERLNQTTFTQPALLAASYAIWKIIQNRIHLQPVMLAGHSLGEYTALVCANAITFTDAIKLVAARGQLMQEAVAIGEGAMAAIIGLDDNIVATICREAASSQVLSPANFNSIGQVVIAGHREAVEKAIGIAKEKGAKMAVLIPVSVPSHCDLMREAAKHLANHLQSISIRQPTISVVNNVDVTIYSSADTIRDGLTRQLYSPVQWVKTIKFFMQSNIKKIIECGPGKVLSGLNKRIDKSLQLMTTTNMSDLETLLNLENEGSS